MTRLFRYRLFAGRSVGYADTARHSLALELRYARSRLLIVELATASSRIWAQRL
jgi:hypothetical protein